MIIKISPITEKGKEAILKLNAKYNIPKNRFILRRAGVTLSFNDGNLLFTYSRLYMAMEKLGPQFKAQLYGVIEQNKNDIVTEFNEYDCLELIDYSIGVE